ncbi:MULTISPECIES: non-homologous end joining protein Ku [unclassified Streptomyces]|uniref:non-homologous end joining protein Ku n=1 Tax=unclassified Streptomyces TaxID=2593676 RepID=UPI00081AF678|nr:MULTISPECIES: Ku protein [unclassified Streptomyces]MYQ55273.1 Ku protein [Streptomyces sp. SID4941]SCE35394.1 DNA end-binding protein Ku [Streptomyces sp. PalvLS-984]SDD50591.1 DNA end-binding protein Ku [Streptomyces sp. AmelKG-A3]
MRSIWNGAISFGLVSIPVKLMNATENHSISFRQIHLADGGRIRYRKVCELDEREVSGAETGKGYQDPDGTVVPITDEDLASLPLPTAKTIEIEGFVPASAVDPLQLDSAYYLAANGVSAGKPYALLREALRRSEKVAVAKYALRGRERLGMLRVVDDVIALHGLLWPDEIRGPEGVAPDTDVRIRDAELDLADALMNTLGEADLDTLHDDYREAVEELVAAKAAGEPVEPEGEEEPGGGKVIDLMAALENSVRAAKGSQGQDDGEVADVHPIESGRAASKRGGGGGGTEKAGGAAAEGRGSKARGAKGAGPKKEASDEAGGPAGTKKASEAREPAAKKKAAAKKSSTGTTTAKRSPAKKSPAKKSPAKKSSAGKASAAKSAASESSAKKKTAAKKTAAKKSSSGTRRDASGTSSRPARTRTSA